MVLLLTACALLVIAFETTTALWPRNCERAPGSLERATYCAATAVCLWIATTWALALSHLLTQAALLIRAVLLLGLAGFLLFRQLRNARLATKVRKGTVLFTLALVPILLWSETMLWRAAIVPPLSHDALSYHLPKAVLFARADGFAYLRDLDPRQRNIPANYEMLLAEIIVTQHRDTFTEWPSVAFYLLFVLASGGLAEQWWRESRTAGLVVMLFAGAVPVAMLHSGAHKNDLLVAFTMVTALVCAGRWIAMKELAVLRLLIAILALGLGTKPQVATLALCLAPFVLYPLLRARRIKTLAAHAVFAVVAFVLLGGIVYFINWTHEHSMMGRTPDAESVVTFGDWRNLWEGPYILLAAPFARSSHFLHVPWESEPYFWRRNEIYFSHLGIPLAVCAFALPIAIWSQRKREKWIERIPATIAAFAAFALMLPVVFRPHGMYGISLPRYVLFLVPVVFSWTVGALAFGRRRTAGLWIAGTLTLLGYGADTLLNDRFCPLDYVLWARNHPGTREIPFDSSRAASAVDRLAGPSDKIAFDATYASWVYPAFGAELSRPVFFIPAGSGAPIIPDDAKWVVVDRSWNIIWGRAGMKDLTEYRLLGHGLPEPEDLRVRRALLRDRRFRLVYWKPHLNQLVFQRVANASPKRVSENSKMVH